MEHRPALVLDVEGIRVILQVMIASHLPLLVASYAPHVENTLNRFWSAFVRAIHPLDTDRRPSRYSIRTFCTSRHYVRTRMIGQCSSLLVSKCFW